MDLNYIQLRKLYSLKVTTRPVPDLPHILESIRFFPMFPPFRHFSTAFHSFTPTRLKHDRRTAKIDQRPVMSVCPHGTEQHPPENCREMSKAL